MNSEMKGHIDTDAESGLVQTVRGASGNVSDVVEGKGFLHGEETHAFGDAGYQGIANRPDAKASVTWHVTMRPGKRPCIEQRQRGGCLYRQGRKDQSRHPGQSGASTLSDQAPIWICESALSGIGKENSATRHTVCAVEFMYDARQTDGSTGISAPEIRGKALQGLKSSLIGEKKSSATLKGCA